MMRRSTLVHASLLLCGVFLILFGCARRSVQVGGPGAVGPGGPGEAKVTEETIAKQAPIREVPVTPGVSRSGDADPARAGGKDSPLKDVFFDFDKAVLTEEAKRMLDENLRWLRTNPAAPITIEGHGDERGTNEYNLALGQHRAKAVRDYLVASGLDPKRISVISYGEERPFVLGHDESAWKWNRRGHFVVNSR
jgi:peptidoglycan-associated lipoprotein